MKIKEGFLLREIAGQWVVVPIGEQVLEINGIITLSESAALLWKELEKGAGSTENLADILCEEYSIDRETALADSEEFVERLREKGFIH